MDENGDPNQFLAIVPHIPYLTPGWAVPAQAKKTASRKSIREAVCVVRPEGIEPPTYWV